VEEGGAATIEQQYKDITQITASNIPYIRTRSGYLDTEYGMRRDKVLGPDG
jgi:hypothetical protein